MQTKQMTKIQAILLSATLWYTPGLFFVLIAVKQTNFLLASLAGPWRIVLEHAYRDPEIANWPSGLLWLAACSPWLAILLGAVVLRSLSSHKWQWLFGAASAVIVMSSLFWHIFGMTLP